jgi:hypothetical protein
MNDAGWSTRDARRAKALRDELAKHPKCPNCGADPEHIDVSSFDGTPAFIINLECSQNCWELDPDGYLDAVGYTDPPVVELPPDPTAPERLGRWWRR